MSDYRQELPQLDAMIEQRFISMREHPAAPLRIYNYTAKAQFEREWNATTRKCRGLILDDAGELIARPFPKFFNYGEEALELPQGPFEVWKKYDGSLGVMYWLNGRPAIASRGGFTGEQALKGTALLEDQYRSSWARLDPSMTYLFEIIYPDNRIVVDYGATEELRLLAIIETATGRERPPDPTLGFPIAESVEPGDPFELASRDVANEEGYVLFWRERGYRLKVKFSDYVRVHHLVTGFTAKGTWEALRAGDAALLAAIREAGTDGFRYWLDSVITSLTEQYAEIEASARTAFATIPLHADRKTQAAAAKMTALPHLIFNMLDGKDYSRQIWDMVQPSRGFETYRRDSE